VNDVIFNPFQIVGEREGIWNNYEKTRFTQLHKFSHLYFSHFYIQNQNKTAFNRTPEFDIWKIPVLGPMFASRACKSEHLTNKHNIYLDVGREQFKLKYIIYRTAKETRFFLWVDFESLLCLNT